MFQPRNRPIDAKWHLKGKDRYAHQVAGATGVHIAQATLAVPDSLQSESDAYPILSVHADWAPNGITVQGCGIATSESSSYSVNFEEWTSPTDGSPSTIETVATSSSTEAEDDGTITDPDVAVGSYIFVDLPADDISWVHVWVTYTID